MLYLWNSDVQLSPLVCSQFKSVHTGSDRVTELPSVDANALTGDLSREYTCVSPDALWDMIPHTMDIRKLIDGLEC